ncbi:MAG: hypothetical protein EAZ89_20955, partial [Bacteroidetes bacterium]
MASTAAFSQTELNVKLNRGEDRLLNWLADGSGKSATLPADMLARFPFLAQLRQARSLGTQSGSELDQIYTLEINSADIQVLINELQQTGAFEYVEENRTLSLDQVEEATFTPDDDSLGKQWYHPFVRSFQAWDISKGKAEVRIGVIDTGLDYGHPEFEGQLYVNESEDINQNGSFEPWPATEVRKGRSGDFDGLDNDGNGYSDDVIGYDFTDQPRSPFGGDYLDADADPWDENEHGTIVSGVIGAKMDNSFGGAGLAPGCRLVVIRAFSANGSGEDDDIARAIVYAADNGIRILNFSFGDIYPSLTMHEAIRYAYNKGVVMIGSAGNGTGDN